VVGAALAKMGPRALPRLIDALRHDDPRVRRGAVVALGKSPRAREAAQPLLDVLRDPEPLVREAALDVLQRILPEEEPTARQV
jgi:HEAT repeat protein